MAKARGGWIAIAVIAVAVIAVWWLRRPDPSVPSDDDTEITGGTTGSGGRRGPNRLGTSNLRGQRVAGTVLFDGAPMAGATVRIVSQNNDTGRSSEPRVVTDGTGAFDFGEVRGTSLFVVAEKARLTATYARIDLRDPEPTPAFDQLRLVLHACDAAIYGTIRDASGGPIAKARVSLGSLKGGAEADDDGRYELCVPVGGSGIAVAADGYATVATQIEAFGRVRRDFELVPEAIVVGRVIRADDKSPVAGALVQLSIDPMARNSEAPGFHYASTDDDGRFRIEAVAPGRYLVRATAERLATERAIDVIAEVGNQEPVTCELTATLSIAGKVVIRGTKTPIAGAHLSFSGRGLEDYRSLDAVSASDGSFEVDHAFPGEYWVWVRDYKGSDEERSLTRSQKFVVDKTDLRDVVVEVEPMASIAGRVTYLGKPVDGASVRASGAFRETDADGRFLLNIPEEGKLALYAESKRLGAFTTGHVIELGKNEHRTGVELALDLSGSIEGAVVDQRGVPVSGVVLAFSLLRGRDFGQATSAEDGTFRAAALSGGGEYVYEVRSADGGIKFPPAEGKRFAPIAVRDGQTHVTGIKVAIRYERLVISGRVVTSKGPVPDAQVRVDPKGKQYWSAPMVRTDVNGAFTVRDLPAGEYSVRASSVRASRVVENVAAGRRDVVLELVEPGSITGKLESFTGRVTVFAFQDDERHRATVTGDTFRIRDVSPGKYRVFAMTDEARVEQEAVVTSGNTTDIALRGPEMGKISGLVVDEEGRPLPDMTCGMSRVATSDASGRFVLRTSVGRTRVGCYGKNLYGETETINLVADQTLEVKITMRPHKPVPRGVAGFETEPQLDEEHVSLVKAGGPAERAGLAVGDVLLEVEGRKASGESIALIESHGPGATVKLKIERDDKERTITLTLGTP